MASQQSSIPRTHARDTSITYINIVLRLLPAAACQVCDGVCCCRHGVAHPLPYGLHECELRQCTRAGSNHAGGALQRLFCEASLMKVLCLCMHIGSGWALLAVPLELQLWCMLQSLQVLGRSIAELLHVRRLQGPTHPQLHRPDVAAVSTVLCRRLRCRAYLGWTYSSASLWASMTVTACWSCRTCLWRQTTPGAHTYQQCTMCNVMLLTQVQPQY
jgi:hypothetical protein